MNKTKLVFGVLIGILCFSCKKNTAQQNSKSTQTYLNSELMLQLINDARTKGCDCVDKATGEVDKMPPVAPLIWNETLASVAQLHSSDMEANHYFSHTSLDGKTFDQRLIDGGYAFRAAGENIAQGQTSEQVVVQSWLSSFGHCKNIMNATFKEMGVARSATKNYWTQMFGTPK